MSSVRAVIDAWTPATRFALYYAPARESAWWTAGCQWLGRDPETGERYTPPGIATLTQRGIDVASLSVAPQRYGWHGTLVAPARCAPGIAPDEVLARAAQWAERQQAFTLDVEVETLGTFVAIRPATLDGATAINAVASSALGACSTLRAMPGEREMQRRLESNLTPRQRELLAAWGYPYVLDEFRFHMTLSDSLPNDSDRQAVLNWWRERVPGLGPMQIDGAALYIEPEPGAPFTLWARLPFGAAA
ncbi:DUF1045 domain-containing protein [Pararobbsia alpina]|uniref:DUF1045 domain-containing protein n=1 Tax=Pararobbsia alpina TaxID=621374 RepID=UPI0039A61F94